ncbi:MAG: phosphate ABC transporter permease subunit PstC [Anaerolineaceae bacterium]
MKNSTTKEIGFLKKIGKALNHGDRPWNGLIVFMSLTVIIFMAAIGFMLWLDSSQARNFFGWKFILPTNDPSWDPVKGNFQAWPFIYGTLITSLFALLIAVPISLGIAIFLAELCPAWLRTPLNWLVELLAAIPSVVYGLWGIFIFLPAVVTPVGNFLYTTFLSIPILGSFFAGPIPQSGSSRLAASLILAIMIIPTISAVSRDVLKAIPDSQREASLALGSTKWESIWKVLLPYGSSGILGAIILGLGRALGETMAVTMVIGNSIEGSISILRPGYTMASIIANEFAEAVSNLHTSSLIEIGFILFSLTLLLNIFARFLVWSVTRKTPQEARS